MNNTILLPYAQSLMKTWPEDCFLLSLLLMADDGLNWICDSRVQIVMAHEKIMFHPSGKQHLVFNVFDDNPFIRKYSIDRHVLYDINNDFSTIVKVCLEHGLYISGLLNRGEMFEVEENDFNHVAYIYGYDGTEDKFYINDNLENGKNVCVKIYANRVRKAFEKALQMSTVAYGNSVINFYYLDKSVKYEINLEKLKTNMKNYLFGIRVGEKSNNQTIWGINVFSALRDRAKDEMDSLDVRNVVFLYDLVTINRIRINRLVEAGIIEENTDFLTAIIEEQQKIAEVALNLTLKYRINRNVSIVNRVISLLNKYEENERVMCGRLLNILQ